jgi:hypothetical protein
MGETESTVVQRTAPIPLYAPAELAAMKAREQAATPLPWGAGHLGRTDMTCQCRYVFSEGLCGSVAVVSVDDGDNDCPPKEQAAANLHLIVEARNDYPRLLALAEWVGLVHAWLLETNAHHPECGVCMVHERPCDCGQAALLAKVTPQTPCTERTRADVQVRKLAGGRFGYALRNELGEFTDALVECHRSFATPDEALAAALSTPPEAST